MHQLQLWTRSQDVQPGPIGARASTSSATSLPCWESDGVFPACCSSSKELVLPLSGAGGAIRRFWSPRSPGPEDGVSDPGWKSGPPAREAPRSEERAALFWAALKPLPLPPLPRSSVSTEKARVHRNERWTFSQTAAGSGPRIRNISHVWGNPAGPKSNNVCLWRRRKWGCSSERREFLPPGRKESFSQERTR